MLLLNLLFTALHAYVAWNILFLRGLNRLVVYMTLQNHVFVCIIIHVRAHTMLIFQGETTPTATRYTHLIVTIDSYSSSYRNSQIFL